MYIYTPSIIPHTTGMKIRDIGCADAGLNMSYSSMHALKGTCCCRGTSRADRLGSLLYSIMYICMSYICIYFVIIQQYRSIQHGRSMAEKAGKCLCYHIIETAIDWSMELRLYSCCIFHDMIPCKVDTILRVFICTTALPYINIPPYSPTIRRPVAV